MKRNFLQFITLSALISASGITLAAEDFSNISNDDFFQMKDQMRTMDDGAKDAYRTERQSRMMNMDQSQKESRLGDMGASGKRNMEQQRQRNTYRKRDGSGGGQGGGKGQGSGRGQGDQSGGGSGNQYRYGQGNDTGSGNQNRYGQGSSSGGGSRYGQGSSSGGGSRGQRR